MYVTAIVLAAGKGSRLGESVSKPLIKINGKPIIVYSLDALSKHPYVKDIIVTVNPKNSKEIINNIRQYGVGKIRNTVLGGKRRQDSVSCALKAMDARTGLVLIHDASRPFINRRMVSGLIEEAGKTGAAITGVPVKATIKRVTGFGARGTGCRGEGMSRALVKETLDRNNLWEIQTPQVFKKELLLRAYDKYADIDVTDDAALVEKLGVKVSAVMGSYSNIKITTPEDLVVAGAILKNSKSKYYQIQNKSKIPNPKLQFLGF